MSGPANVKRVTMIGFGAIGAGVLELVRGNPEIAIDAVVVPDPADAALREALRRAAPGARLAAAVELEAGRPDLIVECAGHSAIGQHVIPALERGVPCLVISVGALSEDGLAERLEEAARRGGTQAQLLPGAIGAIDALAAARLGGLEEVRYVGRKPPQAWKGTPAEAELDLDMVVEPVRIFVGTAREAAHRFPKNANVAATVALAGLGLDATRVELWADPRVEENQHHIDAQGAFGRLELTMSGKPLRANPKTSALTVFCVARALTNSAHAITI
ncbi:MAG TPA: aspartate dehydrogenase [Aromatoleum sp.]|uniref:aspartate dehydrogenase n=1 Tax=Aromatoleum sp. TaxID=2307007 RepID=UPI002B48DA48|nr:aspartate dehydrogenase [Aromatoleum sp.]HJV27744.1 aspartate dehydrogenase [Aromatoleum sp.]